MSEGKSSRKAQTNIRKEYVAVVKDDQEKMSMNFMVTRASFALHIAHDNEFSFHTTDEGLSICRNVC